MTRPTIPLARLATRLLTAALVTALTGAPATTRAESDEWTVSIGAGAWIGVLDVADETVASTAPIAHLGLRYGLDDFWQLGGSLDAGVALSADHDPALLTAAHVEIYYFIDIIEWVLWANLGVGATVRGAHPEQIAGTEDGVRADLSTALGVGLDYRPARDWSVGGLIRYQLLPTDLDGTQPAFFVTLCYSLYFE